MLENEPRISVVTCCRNQGAFIDENICSALDQNHSNFEHIVIDSGDDNTREICARYDHVRYLFQEPAGQCAALNLGFSKADGDIIAWLNADDYYTPGAFKRVIETFRDADCKTLVGGEAEVVDAEGNLKWKLKNGPAPFYRLLAHPLLFRKQGRCAIPCQPTVFFRKALLDEIGMLREDLKYGMDYEYWLRAMTHGYRFVHVPQVFACYRYHDDSLTNKGYETFLPDWQSISNEYFAGLSPWRKIKAKFWHLYFVCESVLFRQHKKAEAILTKLRNGDRQNVPLSEQIVTVIRVVARAPWLAFNIISHVLRDKSRDREEQQ